MKSLATKGRKELKGKARTEGFLGEEEGGRGGGAPLKKGERKREECVFCYRKKTVPFLYFLCSLSLPSSNERRIR